MLVVQNRAFMFHVEQHFQLMCNRFQNQVHDLIIAEGLNSDIIPMGAFQGTTIWQAKGSEMASSPIGVHRSQCGNAAMQRTHHKTMQIGEDFCELDTRVVMFFGSSRDGKCSVCVCCEARVADSNLMDAMG